METAIRREAWQVIDRLIAERDRLRAACKMMLREFVPARDKFTGAQADAFDAARAAIKLAEIHSLPAVAGGEHAGEGK